MNGQSAGQAKAPTPRSHAVAEFTELIAELARVLKQEEAGLLLTAAGFPEDRAPRFNTPLVYWTDIVSIAKNGVLEGVVPLAKAAADLYPNNKIFKKYSDTARIASGRKAYKITIEANGITKVGIDEFLMRIQQAADEHQIKFHATQTEKVDIDGVWFNRARLGGQEHFTRMTIETKHDGLCIGGTNYNKSGGPLGGFESTSASYKNGTLHYSYAWQRDDGIEVGGHGNIKFESKGDGKPPDRIRTSIFVKGEKVFSVAGIRLEKEEDKCRLDNPESRKEAIDEFSRRLGPPRGSGRDP